MIICTMPQCQTTAGCICGLPFAPVGRGVTVRAAAPINRLQVLEALHSQIEGLELKDADRQLANAILIILNIMIDERRALTSAEGNKAP
jgi:hypothetical protein